MPGFEFIKVYKMFESLTHVNQGIHRPFTSEASRILKLSTYRTLKCGRAAISL